MMHWQGGTRTRWKAKMTTLQKKCTGRIWILEYHPKDKVKYDYEYVDALLSWSSLEKEGKILVRRVWHLGIQWNPCVTTKAMESNSCSCHPFVTTVSCQIYIWFCWLYFVLFYYEPEQRIECVRLWKNMTINSPISRQHIDLATSFSNSLIIMTMTAT